MEKSYDVVVLGGGIGGYPAAVVLAKRGLRVALVEENSLGGECTNYGCIPSKALLHYSWVISEATRLGMRLGSPTGLLGEALRYAARIVEEDRSGLEFLMEKAGVEVIRGHGVFRAKNGDYYIAVNGSQHVHGENIILAPGSNPLVPGWVEKCSRVLDNRGLFTAEDTGLGSAGKIAIIGGGVIGVELSQALSRLGVGVEVYEALPRLLPGLGDRDASLIAKRILTGLGVKTHLSSPVEKVKCTPSGAEVCLKGECKPYDYVVLAIGRKPRTGNIGLEEAGLLDGKGYIVVDEKQATRLPGVYAAGDATGEPFLAHKAAAESLRASSQILGEKPFPEGNVVPMVVYGEPEIVLVKKGDAPGETRSIKNYWGYNAVARIRGTRAQLVYARIDYEPSTGRIVGALIAGPHASELAGELALIVNKGLRLQDLAGTIHPHPTASESVWETVLASLGYTYNRA